MNATLSGALVLVGRKLLTAFVQLWLVATLIFSVMYIMPGDPVLLLLGAESNPSPEAVAAMRGQLGLDQPVISQYFVWLWNALHLDFGKSLTNGYPVAKYVTSNLPRTLELAFAAIIVAALIGVPLGIAAALKRGSLRDTVLTSIATIGISVPVYILGTLLVLFFSIQLGWLPASGYTDISRNVVEHFRKLALPAFALGFGLAASIARMTRSSMLEILGRDFVRALRAKGMSEHRIIWQHVLRNAAIPIVTIIGLQLGNLMGGTVLVEAMFNWPGLSTLLVSAVSARNYPLVQGSMLAIAALFILINLVVELFYSLLDPRIRRRRS
ncbi:ABC transporter permease [Chelatococcus asaccharovorans]|uniref:Peptide/nickel transport system permease protein n=1 Tax=Chelatococcus asaccharovorans TaxID=28210 RepID=A0A2V3UDK0_9HYPH|nr:ABC transporter permease [Chelatococcus asaccharovorans]MBS7707130.1 ABC transporter permease [Chelatococcus asaccharovorans]PXW63312.1 peptide/nickel transport system permease protein [Chelatococcus asaccharovorans]CAH1652441.1 Peptide/nickel transport system permease protein [Chelatococcus asaccharovorans]CAH1693534.1 Peptide/nickel transport system permease protein [Chelatococcus asaccharovorans]